MTYKYEFLENLERRGKLLKETALWNERNTNEIEA